MSRSCFGVEPCPDGSGVIATKHEGGVSVTRVVPGSAQSSQVVEFVRKRARSPRVCVASYNARGLNLALAFGALPDAEVMLTRPVLLGPVNGRGAGRGEPVGVALANYARRAA